MVTEPVPSGFHLSNPPGLYPLCPPPGHLDALDHSTLTVTHYLHLPGTEVAHH